MYQNKKCKLKWLCLCALDFSKTTGFNFKHVQWYKNKALLTVT